MTNHVHILVTPEVADGTSRLMQDTGREFVRYINTGRVLGTEHLREQVRKLRS